MSCVCLSRKKVLRRETQHSLKSPTPAQSVPSTPKPPPARSPSPWSFSGREKVRESSTSPVFSGLVTHKPSHLIGSTLWIRRLKIAEGPEGLLLAQKLRREINRLAQHRHRNLLRYRGCDIFRERKEMEIYTDAAHHFCTEEVGKPHGEATLIKYAHQMLQALRQLAELSAEKGRNVCAENIVLDTKDNMKLAWFAGSEIVRELRRLNGEKRGAAGPAPGENNLMAAKEVILKFLTTSVPRNPEWSRLLARIQTESRQLQPNYADLLQQPLFASLRAAEEPSRADRRAEPPRRAGTGAFELRGAFPRSNTLAQASPRASVESSVGLSVSESAAGSVFAEALEGLKKDRETLQKEKIRREISKHVRKMKRLVLQGAEAPPPPHALAKPGSGELQISTRQPSALEQSRARSMKELAAHSIARSTTGRNADSQPRKLSSSFSASYHEQRFDFLSGSGVEGALACVQLDHSQSGDDSRLATRRAVASTGVLISYVPRRVPASAAKPSSVVGSQRSRVRS